LGLSNGKQVPERDRPQNRMRTLAAVLFLHRPGCDAGESAAPRADAGAGIKPSFVPRAVRVGRAH
jgi:hypothetical protein